MHELGHTLGLGHGGPFKLACPDKNTQQCEINFKPNYLSVMNYNFQLDGLITKDGAKFDYSRFDNVPSLKEDSLSETKGLSGGDQPDSYGTKHYCAKSIVRWRLRDGYDVVNKASAAIDWNCNNKTDQDNVRANVNGKGGDVQELKSYNDWARDCYALSTMKVMKRLSISIAKARKCKPAKVSGKRS